MNRLRAYRAIEGLNQQQLGDLLGLSTPMISMAESGRRPFHGSLAPLGYSDDRFQLPDMSEPLHRQKASTKAPAKARAHELLRLAGEVFGELRGRTPKAPHTTIYKLPPPTTVEDIEDLSREMRLLLGHEEAGPIQNLTTLVERAGVCLIPLVGLEGMDGISAWVGDVPVIGLSPSVPGDRFRLTLGHELAHLGFHTRKASHTESEANSFSGALLFPRAEFDAALPADPQLRDFVGLKTSWGVSVAALVYRAHDLEYIDDQRYRALQIQMSRWRRSEPARFEPAHGKLLPKLVEVNGGVNTVAESLGIAASHIAELVNWSHLRIART